MKEIPLTQGKFALVDDDDYDWLNQWKWYANKGGNTFYACRHPNVASGKRTIITMHVDIMGKKEGLVTDHINGNGLDNRRINLRHVTHRQNLQNRHGERSSKYPGVQWKKIQGGFWTAQFRHKEKCKHLGCFSDELDAYNAYCKAISELGEIMLQP